MYFQEVGFFSQALCFGRFYCVHFNPNGGFKTTIRAPYEGLARPFEPLQLKMTKKWTYVFWKLKCLLISLFTLSILGKYVHFNILVGYQNINFFQFGHWYEHEYSNALEMDIKQVHLMFTCFGGILSLNINKIITLFQLAWKCILVSNIHIGFISKMKKNQWRKPFDIGQGVT
jgi:hypothetical protein